MRGFAERCLLAMATVWLAAGASQGSRLLQHVWRDWSARSRLRAIGRGMSCVLRRRAAERLVQRVLFVLDAHAAQVQRRVYLI